VTVFLWWKLMQLRFGTAKRRQKVLYDLKRSPQSKAVPTLIAIARKGGIADSSEAVEALGKCKDSRAVETLVAIACDSQSYSNYYAARALGEIGDSKAVPLLVTALAKRNARYPTAEIAKTLGILGDRAAIPTLEDLLIAPSQDALAWKIRREAAQALKTLGATPSRPDVALELALALGDREPVIARGLAALDRMKDYSNETTCDILSQFDWTDASKEQKSLGVEIVRDELARQLKARRDFRNENACFRALSKIGLPDTLAVFRSATSQDGWFDWTYHLLRYLPTDVLAKALSSYSETRRDAAEALQKSPRSEAAAALASRHVEREERIRVEVIKALEALVATTTGLKALATYVPDLLKFSEDPSYFVRGPAVQVLAAIPDQRCADRLLQKLADTDAGIQNDVVKVLAKQQDKRLLFPLVRVAANPRVYGPTILEAIAGFDAPEGMGALVELLACQEHECCFRALELARKFLQRDGKSISEPVLHRIMSLPPTRSWEWSEQYMHESPSHDELITTKGLHVLDFSELKSLAQSEMARRASTTG
jgi:HEAT repeat protein